MGLIFLSINRIEGTRVGDPSAASLSISGVVSSARSVLLSSVLHLRQVAVSLLGADGDRESESLDESAAACVSLSGAAEDELRRVFEALQDLTTSLLEGNGSAASEEDARPLRFDAADEWNRLSNVSASDDDTPPSWWRRVHVLRVAVSALSSAQEHLQSATARAESLQREHSALSVESRALRTQLAEAEAALQSAASKDRRQRRRSGGGEKGAAVSAEGEDSSEAVAELRKENQVRCVSEIIRVSDPSAHRC
jgi:hypothetical protein